jgi:glycerate 2-kinase
MDASPDPRGQLRTWAQAMMRTALDAVDPAAAVRKHLRLDGETLVIEGQGEQRFDLRQYERVLVVGGGKAGAPMTVAAAQVLGPRLTEGAVVVKYGHCSPDEAHRIAESGISILEAAHPIPDAASIDGAQRIEALLQQATERDLVLALLSGGGSALLTLPAAGISLADLQSTTQTLLSCGATINEMNTIRKHLSRLKGGGLARLAAPAAVICLTLSDVVGDPLDVIASGPTVPDPMTFADAWKIVEKYQIAPALPSAVVAHLQRGLRGETADTPKPGDEVFKRVTNAVIGSNRQACQAAVAQAEALGLHAAVLTTYLEGEAREVGKIAAGLAKGLSHGETSCPWPTTMPLPACLILGGETTVTLRGGGRGGRNSEAALAAAISLAGWEDVLIAFLATDGTDGPTDAAGAFADGGTLDRAARLGLDAADYLARNDSYTFFQGIDDLIITGPTQTNVNDIVLILVGRGAR